MAKWHVNPTTGQAGQCSAVYACPFGGALGGHEDTKKAAAKLYENYRDGLYDPEAPAYFYFMSDEENEMFTWGDCGHLARELHKRTGYPVAAIGIRGFGETEVSWQHMTVKTPEGRYLDVTGIQPESNLREAWSQHVSLKANEELVIEELLESQIEKYLANPKGYKAYSESNPEATAGKVLKALKEEL